jgi:TRAP-type uncharacterized transport system substrate-binding protein
MNLSIIILFLVILILYNIQSNIFKKITYTEEYTIGITNNTNVQIFLQLLLQLTELKINIKNYSDSSKLLEDVNNHNIDFAITNEDNLMDSHLGLNSFNKNKMDNLRFITGLFYNYQYFLTDLFYSDSNKSIYLKNISDIKNFYKVYKRHIIIGTEGTDSDSFMSLIILLYVYGFNPVNINSKDTTKEYSDNTVFYANYKIDELIVKFNKNGIDGIYLVNIYNYKKIREILDKKDVLFLDVDYKNTIFNDVFSNYFYKKNITISNFSEDLDSTYSFETKASRILLICNNNTNTEAVEKLIKLYYTNNNSLINTLLENDSLKEEHTTFEPLDMVYINKYISIHPGAYNYMKELGFIINDSIKKQITLNNNDHYKHYWKYDKIGLNNFTLIE